MLIKKGDLVWARDCYYVRRFDIPTKEPLVVTCVFAHTNNESGVTISSIDGKLLGSHWTTYRGFAMIEHDPFLTAVWMENRK